MIEIIKEKKGWDALVKEFACADFYHTYEYHQAVKIQGQEPVLIHYTEDDKTIVLPLLFRNIEYSRYKDATSVYGYPGPITKNITSDFDNSVFQKEIHQLFLEQKIISVFSRLNPFIPNQANCFKDLGITETMGRAVYIDLRETHDEQWKLYHRRLRTYINKSRTIYEIKNAIVEEDLGTFIELYYENMRRVNAHKEFFFNRKYFLDLINSNDFKSEVLLAISKTTGEVAGGCMFVKKNNIIHYHLSGTSEIFLDLNPLKLLIDEMRIRGSREQYSYLNLGGGIGAREDTLFYFKSGFSKYTKPFKVWKYIVNRPIYKNLVQQRNGGRKFTESAPYFPQYRASNIKTIV